MLLSQTVLMGIFAYYITYNVMGRNYEAAVIAAANCGFGMGATPNAIANMKAITERFGPAPQAFFVVPLVGGLFVDFVNAGIITFFINLFH
ncbi:MAG: sodium/glutamate symporter, partial [Acidaminococcaceae bacterium]